MDVYLVNLEEKMPSVAQARIMLDQALRAGRQKGCKAVKLIHGYGSSGKGGAIRRDAHAALAAQKKAGKIKAYVPGEEFSPFYSNARAAVEGCPALSRDRDYTAANQGITIVLL
ncbi:MAG: Smr/MutS family protein [Oscillospiraceae bacterium]|jgi:hypothetical protein|nr:Smr/MutS family protein [Oscillospiraceae bacterium]